jgi:hypothetical protein
MRNDDLHVALGSQSSRLKERSFGCDATSIDVFAGCNVIQSIGHNGQFCEEFVSEDVSRLFANFIQSGNNVSLEV